MYRRKIDNFRDLQNKVHRLLNVPEERPDMIRSLLAAIRESCGADNVGICFRNGDGFPYFPRNKFTEGILLKGSFTNALAQGVKMCRENNCNLKQECVCSKVISGGAVADSPLFTPNGSFWSNDLPALTDLPENQVTGRFSRNGCSWHGFGSIAITPIRSKGRIVGLLQFGYMENGYFTLEAIELIEDVGNIVGEILLRKQTEKRLEFIKRSNDVAPGAAYWMDLMGNFIHVNESGCRALGYGSDELLQKSLFDIVSETDDGRLGEVRRILKATKRQVTETVFQRRNGIEFPVEIIVNRAVYDGQEYLHGFALEITQRKKAEQCLRDSEARFRATFEQAAVGIVHVAADGRFLRVNQKFCDMLGYSQAEMLQRTFQDLMHPDHLCRSVQGLRELVEGEINTFTVEDMCLRKDGHAVWVSLTISPVRSQKGEAQWFVALVQDVSDRKKTEAALIRSEKRLKEAQKIAHIGNWELDLLTNTLIWSEEIYRIFEIDPEKFKASYEAFLDAVHPDDRASVDRAYKYSVESRTAYKIDHRLMMPDGRIKYVHEQCRTFYSSEGIPLRSLGTTQDNTDLKIAEGERAELMNELAHISRVMSMNELSSSLAHEINQPLGAIMNNASAIRALYTKNGERGEQVEKILGDIIADAARAGEIISKVRGLMSKEPTKVEKLDVNALIKETLELIRNILIVEKVSVSMALQPDLAFVRGDRIRLQQVLINLMTNAAEAMKHCPSRNLTILSVMPSPDTITVSISDSGVGIDAEMKNKIFQSFFTTRKDGLGLGLRICHSIVKEHGGRLWVEDRPGGGATFSFSLKSFQENAV